MTSEQQIRETLAKILGPACRRDHSWRRRQAAQAAMERLAGPLLATEPAVAEAQRAGRGRVPLHLRQPLVLAPVHRPLPLSEGYRPYRYARMRHTSVCVRIDRRTVDDDLWPAYVAMDRELTRYLGELADRIIAESVDPDRSDAEEVAGLPPAASRTG